MRRCRTPAAFASLLTVLACGGGADGPSAAPDASDDRPSAAPDASDDGPSAARDAGDDRPAAAPDAGDANLADRADAGPGGRDGGDSSVKDSAPPPDDGGVTVTISPMAVSVDVSATQAYTCKVTGVTNTACAWSVAEAAGGSITAAGVYTAPATAGTYHVVAASVAAPTATATATVTVVAPVLGDCSALGAVGTWQDITPPEFKSASNLETTTVVADPQHPGTVYASAGNKTNGGNGSVGVFKSTDCGATWSKVSASGSALETGDVWQLLIDPTHPQTLYATNGYGNNPTIYKSSDGAVTFTPLATDVQHVLQNNFVRTASIDPTDAQHLVVSYHELCAAPLSALCMSETHDGGATWRQFNGPPVSQSALGGDGGGPVIVSEGAIYFFQPGSGAWYTPDAGQTWALHFQWYNYPSNTDPNTPYNAALPTTYGGPGYGYVGTAGFYVSFGGTGMFEIAAPYDPAALTPSAWKLLQGSPAEDATMIDDGMSLFVSALNDNTGQSYYFAPLGAGTPWQKMTPGGGKRGAGTFTYDSGHHVIYSANWGAGLWRLTSR
jgi:hypothetical protein